MQILTEIKQSRPDSKRPLILGLGNFDGLHLGHQALVRPVIREAARCKGIPALMTFRSHPQHVLRPSVKKPLLVSGPYKLFLFAQAGIKVCFWLDFTQKFAKTDPVLFVREWLLEKLGVREVCMGYNARFGRDRKGDGALMGLLSRELGFTFSQIPPVKAAGETVSSSRIRSLVDEGRLKEAHACLGRPFSLLGRVVHGAGRGKSLGFPTANLELGSTVLPPRGVYPVWVRRIKGLEIRQTSPKEQTIQPRASSWIKGVLNLGFRPTFEKTKKALHVEVFLLDYKGQDLYGESLEVVFCERLREEKAFSSAPALGRQIRTDCRRARRILMRSKDLLYKAIEVRSTTPLKF